MKWRPLLIENYKLNTDGSSFVDLGVGELEESCVCRGDWILGFMPNSTNTLTELLTLM